MLKIIKEVFAQQFPLQYKFLINTIKKTHFLFNFLKSRYGVNDFCEISPKEVHRPFIEIDRKLASDGKQLSLLGKRIIFIIESRFRKIGEK